MAFCAAPMALELRCSLDRSAASAAARFVSESLSAASALAARRAASLAAMADAATSLLFAATCSVP